MIHTSPSPAVAQRTNAFQPDAYTWAFVPHLIIGSNDHASRWSPWKSRLFMGRMLEMADIPSSACKDFASIYAYLQDETELLELLRQVWRMCTLDQYKDEHAQMCSVLEWLNEEPSIRDLDRLIRYIKQYIRTCKEDQEWWARCKHSAVIEPWILRSMLWGKDSFIRELCFLPLGKPLLLGVPASPRPKTITSLLKDDCAKSSRSYIELKTDGVAVNALSDTGVGRNIMSLDHAQKCGASIDSSSEKQHTLSNAVGQEFRCIGEATVRVAFPDRLTPARNVVFSILEICSEPLVMGRAFLKTTSCLTRFRHRLIKVARSAAQSLSRVMHMDSSSERLSCQVSAQRVAAYADTGSDVDLVSLQYASEHMWGIIRNPGESDRVTLSDGSVHELEGYVDLPITIGAETSMRRFYVLAGLVYDVLLGAEVLDQFDIWNEHTDSLIQIEAFERNEYCNIAWYKRFDQVEKEVDDMIKGTFTPVKQRTRLTSFKAMFGRGGNDARGARTQHALAQRLYEIDNIEKCERPLAQERIAGAVGDAKVAEVNSDEDRQQRWLTLRTKIVSLQKRVQADGTLAPGS
ncbi:uncharacterized protein AB675_7414 [Cyphellophora attinorum]|uniref:Uncharacterized protein n=1 Tax=Cyphellophora attinorum TaxID=1664694 RepID=A0A0N1GX22_9EURO|nr:uncharacterized protein AB675_7414 [Phialophora attinorum]KPI34542.1 hypothetical protein AB675_7414 [Phialophora attinorum]